MIPCRICNKPSFGTDGLCTEHRAPREGRKLAQEGIATAEEHADAEAPGWSAQAFDFLRQFTPSAPAFMAEDVRRFAEGNGLPPPPDPRAWGGVMQRASRASLIEKAGYAESSNSQAHCRPTQLWRFNP